MEELLEVAEETHDSVGHRRMLITQAVAQAWLWLHTKKKDYIIKPFKQEGISWSLEDAKLYVRDLPDITAGPRQMEDFSDTLDADEEVEYTVEDAHAGIPTLALDLC